MMSPLLDKSWENNIRLIQTPGDNIHWNTRVKGHRDYPTRVVEVGGDLTDEITQEGGEPMVECRTFTVIDVHIAGGNLVDVRQETQTP